MSFSLNELFTNHAVFPHSKPIKVYGRGEGEVSVNFNGQTLKTVSKNGQWQVEFPKMECGGPYTLTAECLGKTETRDDIYIGEVILICGQSNLQFKLHESTEANEPHPDNDKLRLFVPDRLEEGEFFKTADGWVKCKAETVHNWSALGYQIANEINRKSGIAVGIIACYQGASVIQSWMPEAVAKSKELFICAKKSSTPLDKIYSSKVLAKIFSAISISVLQSSGLKIIELLALRLFRLLLNWFR